MGVALSPAQLQANISAAELAAAQSDLAAMTAFQEGIATGAFTAAGLGQAIQNLEGNLTNPALIRGAQGLADKIGIFTGQVTALVALATAAVPSQ